MTRFFTATLLLATLCLSGCGKIHSPFGKKNPNATPALAAAPGDPSAPGAEPPSPPELRPAASAAAPASALATPPPPHPRAAVDQSASVMCLCYHNIEDGGKMRALTITTAQFESEMQKVKDSGFSVIGMQDFLAWRRGEKNIPHKSCVVTIDDGWVSGYTNAWPVLKKFNFPFTLFIYVNYIGTGGKSLSWDQLAEMRDSGVDIQCHTWYHSNLKAPAKGVDKHTADMVTKDIAVLGRDGWLRKEIIDSKKALEQRLGIKVNAIAYPFGIYSPQVRELVKEAGYEAAFTVYGQRLTPSSPYDELGRYAVEEAKPKIFEDAIAMIGGGMGTADAAAGPTVGQFAAASMVTQPMDKEVIMTGTPVVKANIATMGEIEAGSVEVRVSGVGLVPLQFDAATKMVTAPIKQPLHVGAYSVILAACADGVRKEARWDFSVSPAAAGALPAAATTAMPTTADDAATPAPKGGRATPAPKKKK